MRIWWRETRVTSVNNTRDSVSERETRRPRTKTAENKENLLIEDEKERLTRREDTWNRNTRFLLWTWDTFLKKVEIVMV